MKQIISVAALLFFLTGSALASVPETSVSILTLGNQQYVLKKNLDATSALAAIIVDPAVSADPAELFGVESTRIVTYRPAASFDAQTDVEALKIDLTAPLYIILGQTPESVWAMNLALIKAAPSLIQAVMKGETAVLGATYDAETGAVTMLGSHPDLPILAAQHVLGTALTPTTSADADVDKDAKTEMEPAAVTPTAETDQNTDKAPHAAPVEAGHAVPEAGHDETSEGGSSGPLVIVLFIAALIGAVIFMDKTVLKP